MRPLDVAHAAVGGPGVVVTELRADDAAPDDLGRTAPGVNDVAGTHRAGEVPDHSRRACRPAAPVPVAGLQRLDDGFLIRVAGGVTDPVPVERHDPGRSKLLPLPGTLTRDVEPVAALLPLGRLSILVRRRHRLAHDSSSSPVPAALRARPGSIVVPAHPIGTSRVRAPPGLDIDAVGDIPRGRVRVLPARDVSVRPGAFDAVGNRIPVPQRTACPRPEESAPQRAGCPRRDRQPQASTGPAPISARPAPARPLPNTPSDTSVVPPATVGTWR